MKLMHNILLIILLCLFGTNVSAEIKTDDQKEAFNTAYTEYLKLTSENKYRAALPYAKILYELAPNLYKEGDKSIAAVTYNYGHVLLNTSNQKEAREILKETIDLYEELYGKDSIELVSPLMELGEASAKLGNSPSQTRYYNRALKLMEKSKGKKDLEYAELLLKSGSNVLRLSKTPDSRRYFKEAYDIYAKELGEEHHKTGIAAFYLGKFQLAKHKYHKAEELFNKALATFKKPDKPSNFMELSTHAFLVEVYEKQGESDKATEHCQAIGRMTPWQTVQEQTPVFKTPPIYPTSALRRRIEGEIVVSFTVSQAGMVNNPSVYTSSGNEQLDQAAIEAIKKWRYAPRFENGEAVNTENSMARVIFKIER